MHQAYGIYTNDTEAKKNEQEERREQQKIKALLYLAPNQSTKSAIDMEFPSLYLQTQNKDYKETRILMFSLTSQRFQMILDFSPSIMLKIYTKR